MKVLTQTNTHTHKKQEKKSKYIVYDRTVASYFFIHFLWMSYYTKKSCCFRLFSFMFVICRQFDDAFSSFLSVWTMLKKIHFTFVFWTSKRLRLNIWRVRFFYFIQMISFWTEFFNVIYFNKFPSIIMRIIIETPLELFTVIETRNKLHWIFNPIFLITFKWNNFWSVENQKLLCWSIF